MRHFTLNAQLFCSEQRSSVPRQACAVAAGSLQLLKTFACNLHVYSGHAEGLNTLRALFSNLINNKSGVTAIEYALIAALIAVAAIAAFTLVGTNLSSTFSAIAGQL